MFVDAATGRAAFADHHQTGDLGRRPTPLGGDPARQPYLAVEDVDRRLHVRHDRLDLDDQQGLCRPMPGEDVDRAVLPVDREADLRDRLPTRLAKQPEDELDEGGMVGIEEPIGGLAVPVHAHPEPRPERLQDPLQCPNRETPGAASFDSSDERLRDGSPFGEVPLAPSATEAERSDNSTNRTMSIAESMGTRTYQSLIPR